MDNKPQKTPWYLRGKPGQAAVEYALIALLVGGAITVALLATGPFLSNIFSSALVATIGEDNEIRPTLENGPTAFWMTVTWVSEQTFVETAFPTNIANPQPTDTPDGWEPPPPEPVDPTDIPQPTATQPPSPTPPDRNWDLPFEDVASDRDWYRLSNSIYLGQNAWEGLFWEDTAGETTYDPFSNPSSVQLVRAYDANHKSFLTPLTSLPGMKTSWFSARYDRPIFVYGDAAQRLTFNIENPAGGVRIYYQSETGLCSNYRPPTNQRNTISPPIECLIVDEWKNVPPDSISVDKTFQPGPSTNVPAQYTLYIEYYQQTGTPNLYVDISSAQLNPDDAPLAAQPVECLWQQYEGDRTNTRTFSWSYAVGVEDMPNNSRCYLELRGYIALENTDNAPPTFTLTSNPAVMSFWHIWDLNPDVDVSLEVAAYDPSADADPGTPGQQIRETLAWEKVWPASGRDLSDSFNYEWTREQVTLDNFNPGETVTYRFVIESNGNSDGRKRWYVDDIQIGNETLPDLLAVAPASEDTFTICGGSDRNSCLGNGYWSMDSTDAAQDFRTTGRWAITNNSGAVSGMAWEDDPGYAYSLEDGASDNPTADGASRIYWIEFDKRVDVSSTSDTGLIFNSDTPDYEGDAGAPLLTFWQTYNLKDNARLELQYYDDINSEWRLLRTIAASGSAPGAGISRPDRHYFEVPLHLREVPGTGVIEDFDDGWTDWATKPLRLRFAMIVQPDARSAPNAPGWTIDDILLERLGEVQFTPYPLYDSAGDGDGLSVAQSRTIWTRTGLWEVGSGRVYGDGGGQFAYSDSPTSDYVAGSNTRLELRAPIDLYSNTPSNPAAINCDATLDLVEACAGTPQAAAINPMLTFWWNRDIGQDHTLLVEIRPNGGAGTPIPVWEYVYNADDATQPAWERVEIALAPFLPDTGSDNDDDILITFRLDARANATATADGVWIDEIRIQDQPINPMFILADTTNGGDGQYYYDDVDERQLLSGETFNTSTARNPFARFYMGGSWTVVQADENFDAKTGIYALHESPPLGNGITDSSYRYDVNTFNTLEMVRHFDLSQINTLQAAGDPVGYNTGATDTSPVLSWWQLYNKGKKTQLRVEIAAKDTIASDPSGPLTYGDDELYGWSPWKTVYITPSGAYDSNVIEAQWVRERINLEYAPTFNDDGTPTGNYENFVGKTIRVRFVTDANDTVNVNDTRDGWYVDNIQLSTFKPRLFALPLSDDGRSMSNWTPEGKWGIDVENYRGGVNIPALPGDSGWTVRYLNCDRRPDPNTGTKATNNKGSCNADTFEDMLTEPGYRTRYTTDTSSGSVNEDNQWYVEGFIASLPFSINFGNSNSGGRPPGTPANWSNYDWNSDYVAEYQRTITVSEPYRYQLYAATDDGVRVGITPWPTTNEVNNFAETQFDINQRAGNGNKTYTDTSISSVPIEYNNIINDWGYHGVELFTGAVTLVPNADSSPRDYILTIHYFQGGGGASIDFGLGGANGSFSDAPTLVPVDDPANQTLTNPYSNTSMYLNGLLDLRGANKPIFNFYTKYDIPNSGGEAYFEVSADGGFTWTNNNITNSLNVNGSNIITNSNSWDDDNSNWEEKTYNLSSYAGQLLAVRFRVDIDKNQNQINNNNWYGVNIASILAYDVEPASPIPQIINQSDLNVTAQLNEEALLQVVATGSAPLRYEWFTGSITPTDPNIVPAGATRIATGVTSFVPDTSLTGTRKYWVRVSNGVSDNNSSVDPAISGIWTVRTDACVAVTNGDCGIYRIQFNGTDIGTNDGSSPGWGGTDESADAAVFLPSGYDDGGGVRNEIDIASDHPSYYAELADNDSVDGEALYERYIRRTDAMTWDLPIENGAYIVRLYMSDYNNNSNIGERKNGRFSLFLENQVANLNTEPVTGYGPLAMDGGVGTSVMEIIRDSAMAVDSSYPTDGSATALNERNNRVAAILEMEPVSVSDGVLSINLTPAEDSGSGSGVNIMGLEVIPVTTDVIQIIDQPGNRRVATGQGTKLTVKATGDINYVAWYEGGTVGDKSSATLLREVTYTNDISLREDTLTLNNVTAINTYWASVEDNTPGEEEVVYSSPATVDVCNYDPTVPGSCDRFYISAGRNSADSTFTTIDGVVWHPDEPYRDSAMDLKSNGENGWLPDNFDRNHTHDNLGVSVFQTWVTKNNFEYAIPMNNGTYTVRLYHHDPQEFTDRTFDVLFEGIPYENSYNIYTALDDQTQLYRQETYTVTVQDGTLNIRFDNDNRPSLISALEIVPQSSAETFVWPQDIIVDTDDTSATLSGSWTTSTSDAGYYGADYLQDGNTGDTDGDPTNDKTVTYNMDLPEDGIYEVFARWTAGSNRATNAQYTVTYKGGSQTILVDQTKDDAAWVSLGWYPFEANSSDQVVLSNANANNYVIADAIKFEYRAQDYLISDGGLETGLFGAWDSMDNYYTSPNRNDVTILSDDSNNGTYSAQLCQAGNAGGGTGLWQNITVEPNTDYQIKAYIKDDGTANGAYLYGKKTDDTNEQTSPAITNTTFQEITLSYTTVAGQTDLQIGLWKPGGTGCVVVDDFSIAKMTYP